MKCRAKVQKINETTTLFCFFYIKKEIVTLITLSYIHILRRNF